MRKNTTLKRSFLYTIVLTLLLVSCKKEIEKVNDTIQGTADSIVETSEAERIL
jgi:hypothetical protein